CRFALEFGSTYSFFPANGLAWRNAAAMMASIALRNTVRCRRSEVVLATVRRVNAQLFDGARDPRREDARGADVIVRPDPENAEVAAAPEQAREDDETHRVREQHAGRNRHRARDAEEDLHGHQHEQQYRHA